MSEMVLQQRIYRQIIDLLLLLSDEIEMGRLPDQGPVDSLRLAAALVALTGLLEE